ILQAGDGKETELYCTEDGREETLIASVNGVLKDNFLEGGSVGSKITKVVKPLSNDYLPAISKQFCLIIGSTFFSKSFSKKTSDPFLASLLMPPEAMN